MRIAFIGASHWHLPLYLDPALALPGVEVVGISDPNPDVTAKLAARLGCHGDPDFRELCRRIQPEFVFALGRHVDMPAEADFLIDEGIPFAIEKPCGIALAEVTRIAKRARDKGAFASVPLVIRNGDYFKLLQELEANDGGIQTMSYRFIAGRPSRYFESGCEWMLDPKLTGGGCTLNLAPHFFDLAMQLFGPATTIAAATMSNSAYGYPVEDYSVVTFQRGGDLCVVETGYLYPAPTSTFDMHFAARSPKRYVIARDQETVEVIDMAGRSLTRKIGTTNVPQYPVYVADVLARAKAGQPPLASLDDMVPIMRLMQDAYRLAGRALGR